MPSPAPRPRRRRLPKDSRLCVRSLIGREKARLHSFPGSRPSRRRSLPASKPAIRSLIAVLQRRWPNSSNGMHRRTVFLSGPCSSNRWRRRRVSTSDINSFDDWIAAEFDERGAFTALVILVDIDGHKVTPLCSTYFSVVGDEVDWAEITVLFAGSGVDWDGASFFPVTSQPG